jgi:hypothetical protein
MISTHAKETAHVLAQHVTADNWRRPATARAAAVQLQ